jgi:hypothetical protein
MSKSFNATNSNLDLSTTTPTSTLAAIDRSRGSIGVSAGARTRSTLSATLAEPEALDDGAGE